MFYLPTGRFAMFLPTTCLSKFVQPAPICSETATLLMVLQALSQGSPQSPLATFRERLILVDSKNHPIGFTSLHKLLPYWMAAGLIEQPPVKAGSASVQADPPVSVDSLLSAIAPSLIEPLALVGGDVPVGQFVSSLPSESLVWVVTQRNGEVLGFLDETRLLQSFLAEIPEVDRLTRLVASSEAHQQILRQQKQITQLTQQLLVQKTELETQVRSQQLAIEHLRSSLSQGQTASSSTTQPYLTSLHSVLGVLEQLPIPLMLQTSGGTVVAQNPVWRQQVGELQDPTWIRHEAAALLETSTEALSATPQPLPTPQIASATEPSALNQAIPSHFPPRVSFQSKEQVQEGQEEFSGAGVLVAPFCQRGPKPDTCICTCSLKNGQEQVLQFVKIPIGVLADFLKAPTEVDNSPYQAEAHLECAGVGVAHTFRLATLTPGAEESRVTSHTATWMGLRSQDTTGETRFPSPETVPASSETLWLILAQDITEQQQLSRELTAKNADLIQLNRLKDEFLACISHELRTPLTAVLGLSSLLKDQTLGELNQRQVHYAQLIYQSGRHLMTVVNDILDLTRMETGQLELVLEPVDVATVCSYAFEQAKQLRLLEDKQGDREDPNFIPQFSLEIEPSLKLIVADELRLRQMLIHLLSNALKFTDIEQQVGLKVGRWGGWIAFTVWDTGIGIPAERQHLIFQKFQQLENPLTRRFEGTGLGLVLTQRLARLHGGDVTFVSKEGQGSQFTILLPPSPPDKTQLAKANDDPLKPQDYPGGRVSLSRSRPSREPSATLTARADSTPRDRLVLIVEAAAQFIETLSDQLTGLGYRVVVARSGTEALEKARRLQPCIIFLNPVLPLLAGWDVLTLLKSNSVTRQIPVIVTASRVDEEQAYSSHADGVLSLPVQAKALRQSLKRLVVETQEPELPVPPSTPLTVLRLSHGIWNDTTSSAPERDLNQLLHSQHCRVLEADDLEQAELLARVWKPNVVLLDGPLLNATAYFQQFSQHTFIASLPLVTLDQETTQAANQVPGMLVFPCLAMVDVTAPIDPEVQTSALLQVIQIAAGYAWRPSILALDIASLPTTSDTNNLLTATQEELGHPPKETEWLQAVTQYLQTAGFRASVGRSWQEVIQQMQSQSVDLLLICWTEADPQPVTLQMFHLLHQMDTKPPILILDHRHSTSEMDTSLAIDHLPTPLKKLVVQVLPPALPMAELLEHIHCAIQGQK